MKKVVKYLSVLSLSLVLGLGSTTLFATQVFAEENTGDGIVCEVKTHENGQPYTECTVTGSDRLTRDDINQFIADTQKMWEQETQNSYYTDMYSNSTGIENATYVDYRDYYDDIESGTIIPVHTCQDDGYPEGYYWSESAQACVTDYVEPTPVPTVVPTPTPVVTPVPTVEPTVEPTIDPKPTEKPKASWNYTAVTNTLLNLINTHRVELGNKPLTFMLDAVADATQRANETLEYAKRVTAYGTTTDGHCNYDTEWGVNEVQGFQARLTGNETEEEIAQAIYTNFTTGLGKNDAVFSDRYTEVSMGYTDDYFYRFSGTPIGFNVYYNILLNK